MRAADGDNGETEIKMLLRRQDVARLRRHPLLRAEFERAGEPVRQDSVYFDDRRRTLLREGVSLRVRQIGNQRIQTIKSLNGQSSPAERSEWQAEISGTWPDFSVADGTALDNATAKLRGPLEPLFETRVARLEFSLEHGNSEIRLALDEGEIHTGDSSAPICEVELELARGSRADLYRLAAALQAQVPLDLSYRTKSARGYSLVGAPDAGFGKAGNPHLRSDMSIADTFRALAHDCLRHIGENRDGVARRDPEALHQIRIGIRRLRSVLSLFRDLVNDRQANELRAELKWLQAETGLARDLDVFLSEIMAPVRAQYPREPAVVRMHQHLRTRRRSAYSAARTAILSPRFRALTLRFAAWIEGGDWRANADALTRARQDAPIEMYAAERLGRLHRKVRKHGRRLRAYDQAGRHRLRLQVKKLRYAAEFLAALASDKKSQKRAQAMIVVLKCLQDKLGGLNDIGVRRSLADEMAGKAKLGRKGRQSRREQLFLAGLIAERQHQGFGPLIEEAEKTFADFRRAKPFWRSIAEFAALPPVLRTPAAVAAPV